MQAPSMQRHLRKSSCSSQRALLPSGRVGGTSFSSTSMRPCRSVCPSRQQPQHASSSSTDSPNSRQSRPSYLVVQSAPSFSPVGGDARIKVIGVGGGGNNALNRMIASGLQVSEESSVLNSYFCASTFLSELPASPSFGKLANRSATSARREWSSGQSTQMHRLWPTMQLQTAFRLAQSSPGAWDVAATQIWDSKQPWSPRRL